ncbi:MAG: DUF4178 domain-containing protein [Planctomycetaceae bacterium]|nr:DUF4178 domain-containing protein [Planctomycetaceae bacterium]
MKTRAASCPSCGGTVEFRASSSLVTICPYCRCVVARGDKAVEDHGKVADLVLTDSPLELGVTGRFIKRNFEVVGRVQYKHPAGGVWDEWYLSFSDGTWGWLAEAQGKHYLTFERKMKETASLPEMASIEVGRRLTLGKRGVFTVAEVGIAETGAAEGEIPWDFVPGRPHRFVDLHGDDQAFATLDYNGASPRLFLGKEISLNALDLSGVGWSGLDYAAIGGGKAQRVEALVLNCPHCGGTLELHAPDETERVGCPHCLSLLDCRQGKLEYLQTLNARRVKPVIPLGTVGTLRGHRYTVIGFMERFVLYEGQTYPWTEYLLHNSTEGFRWLVHSKRHWSFVEPLSPHLVQEKGRDVVYDGQTFKLYDKGEAIVRYVVGEFYWKIQAGESVKTRDYIAPPRMVSIERSGSEENQEINISLGTYLTTDELKQAFPMAKALSPLGVGPIQPRPVVGGVYHLWGLFLLAMVVLHVAISKGLSREIDGGFSLIMLGLLSVIPLGTLLYCHNFEVQRWAESDYSPYSSD